MLEKMLAAWCKQHGIELPEPEYRFARSIGRQWRFDFAWVEAKLAFELEGISGGKPGRHQRPKGFKEDCVKYAEALAMGWRVLRLTQDQVEAGLLLVYLERLLGVVK